MSMMCDGHHVMPIPEATGLRPKSPENASRKRILRSYAHLMRT